MDSTYLIVVGVDGSEGHGHDRIWHAVLGSLAEEGSAGGTPVDPSA
jgi:hypothetical protein